MTQPKVSLSWAEDNDGRRYRPRFLTIPEWISLGQIRSLSSGESYYRDRARRLAELEYPRGFDQTLPDDALYGADSPAPLAILPNPNHSERALFAGTLKTDRVVQSELHEKEEGPFGAAPLIIPGERDEAECPFCKYAFPSLARKCFRNRVWVACLNLQPHLRAVGSKYSLSITIPYACSNSLLSGFGKLLIYYVQARIHVTQSRNQEKVEQCPRCHRNGRLKIEGGLTICDECNSILRGPDLPIYADSMDSHDILGVHLTTVRILRWADRHFVLFSEYIENYFRSISPAQRSTQGVWDLHASLFSALLKIAESDDEIQIAKYQLCLTVLQIVRCWCMGIDDWIDLHHILAKIDVAYAKDRECRWIGTYLRNLRAKTA